MLTRLRSQVILKRTVLLKYDPLVKRITHLACLFHRPKWAGVEPADLTRLIALPILFSPIIFCSFYERTMVLEKFIGALRFKKEIKK